MYKIQKINLKKREGGFLLRCIQEHVFKKLNPPSNISNTEAKLKWESQFVAMYKFGGIAKFNPELSPKASLISSMNYKKCRPHRLILKLSHPAQIGPWSNVDNHGGTTATPHHRPIN